MDFVDLERRNFQIWSNDTLQNVYKCNMFSDVTLVTEDEQTISAHKIVLTSCSTFFENLFTKQSHPQPLVYLPTVSHTTLRSILDFVYLGKAQLEACELDKFLKASKQLKIKWITEDFIVDRSECEKGQIRQERLLEEYVKNIKEEYTVDKKIEEDNGELTHKNSSNTEFQKYINEFRANGYKAGENASFDISRQRTNYSQKQVEQLEAEFSHNQFLTGESREQLADRIGLSKQQIKIWFQNRRMKLKRGQSYTPNDITGSKELPI